VTQRRIRVIALEYGGTISTDREDHVLGQKDVDPQAAAALHDLAGLGMRLLLATNATAAELGDLRACAGRNCRRLRLLIRPAPSTASRSCRGQ
jgi:hypothetical protein